MDQDRIQQLGTRLPACLLVLLAILAYLPALDAGFIIDDTLIPRLTDPSTVVYHQAPWIVLDVGRVRKFTEHTQATAVAGSPRDG